MDSVVLNIDYSDHGAFSRVQTSKQQGITSVLSKDEIQCIRKNLRRANCAYSQYIIDQLKKRDSYFQRSFVFYKSGCVNVRSSLFSTVQSYEYWESVEVSYFACLINFINMCSAT